MTQKWSEEEIILYACLFFLRHNNCLYHYTQKHQLMIFLLRGRLIEGKEESQEEPERNWKKNGHKHHTSIEKEVITLNITEGI